MEEICTRFKKLQKQCRMISDGDITTSILEQLLSALDQLKEEFEYTKQKILQPRPWMKAIEDCEWMTNTLKSKNDCTSSTYTNLDLNDIQKNMQIRIKEIQKKRAQAKEDPTQHLQKLIDFFVKSNFWIQLTSLLRTTKNMTDVKNFIETFSPELIKELENENNSQYLNLLHRKFGLFRAHYFELHGNDICNIAMIQQVTNYFKENTIPHSLCQIHERTQYQDQRRLFFLTHAKMYNIIRLEPLFLRFSDIVSIICPESDILSCYAESLESQNRIESDKWFRRLPTPSVHMDFLSKYAHNTKLFETLGHHAVLKMFHLCQGCFGDYSKNTNLVGTLSKQIWIAISLITVLKEILENLKNIDVCMCLPSSRKNLSREHQNLLDELGEIRENKQSVYEEIRKTYLWWPDLERKLYHREYHLRRKVKLEAKERELVKKLENIEKEVSKELQTGVWNSILARINNLNLGPGADSMRDVLEFALPILKGGSTDYIIIDIRKIVVNEG